MANQTNIITFATNKSYLIDFVNNIIKSENSEDKILLKRLYQVVKTLVTLPPSDYFPKKVELNSNQIILTIPRFNDVDTTYSYFLTKNSQRILQKWLENKFNLIFDQHMECLKNFLDYKTSVYNFIEQYNLKTDCYDMLIKKNQRFRLNISSKKSKNISSQFNRDLSKVSPNYVHSKNLIF